MNLFIDDSLDAFFQIEQIECFVSLEGEGVNKKSNVFACHRLPCHELNYSQANAGKQAL